jgi:hypothetical protein
MATSPRSDTSAAGAVTRFLAEAEVDFDVIEFPDFDLGAMPPVGPKV